MNTQITNSTIFRVAIVDFVAPEYYLDAISAKSKQILPIVAP
jgi:hypothetical protein